MTMIALFSLIIDHKEIKAFARSKQQSAGIPSQSNNGNTTTPDQAIIRLSSDQQTTIPQNPKKHVLASSHHCQLFPVALRFFFVTINN
jgi:hypothetical protein